MKINLINSLRYSRFVQQLEPKDRIVLFEESLKSNATKVIYRYYLKKYFEFIDGQDPFFGNESRTIEQKIIEFIISLKRLQKSYFVIHNHVAPVLTFYATNDIVLNVKKIKRFIPSKHTLRFSAV